MNYVLLFLAGAFLCNCLPHLISGLQGRPFPTPFAKPSGLGPSSPLVNFLWGALNLLIGLFMLANQALVIGPNPDFAALAVGFLIIGVFSALHFAKARRLAKAARERG
jgi:hypothetical protein